MEPIIITEKKLWQSFFLVHGKLASIPQPWTVAVSSTATTDYRLTSAIRSPEVDRSVFQYTLSGNGILQQGNTLHRLEPGTAFLVRHVDPDVSYFYPKDATEPWRFLFFAFDEAGETVSKLNKSLGLIFRLPKSSPIIRRLMRFGEFEEHSLHLDASEGAMLVYGLFSELIDLSQTHLSNSPNVRYTKEATQLIHKHINENYTARKLADDLNVSLEHLCRALREGSAESPLKLITRIKMHRACELLKQTPLSTKEIAARLGYMPGSNFSRLFKRIVGETPVQYRKGGGQMPN